MSKVKQLLEALHEEEITNLTLEDIRKHGGAANLQTGDLGNSINLIMDTNAEEVFKELFADGLPTRFDWDWDSLLEEYGAPEELTNKYKDVDWDSAIIKEFKPYLINYINDYLKNGTIAWHIECSDDDDFGFISIDEALSEFNDCENEYVPVFFPDGYAFADGKIFTNEDWEKEPKSSFWLPTLGY